MFCVGPWGWVALRYDVDSKVFDIMVTLLIIFQGITSVVLSFQMLLVASGKTLSRPLTLAYRGSVFSTELALSLWFYFGKVKVFFDQFLPQDQNSMADWINKYRIIIIILYCVNAAYLALQLINAMRMSSNKSMKARIQRYFALIVVNIGFQSASYHYSSKIYESSASEAPEPDRCGNPGCRFYAYYENNNAMFMFDMFLIFVEVATFHMAASS